MNHLLAIVSSNEKAVPLAAEAASPFFQDAPRDAGTCSGLACFGPDGEPLVSRQPTVGHPSADSLRRSLAGGFLLQQLSETPEGGFKAEEIGPYKFRRWIGTVATPVSSGGDEDHVLAVPAFISQNIKGSRPAEEIFHVRAVGGSRGAPLVHGGEAAASYIRSPARSWQEVSRKAGRVGWGASPRRRAPTPSSHRTCGFPAFGGPDHLAPQACTGNPTRPQRYTRPRSAR